MCSEPHARIHPNMHAFHYIKVEECPAILSELQSVPLIFTEIMHFAFDNYFPHAT